MKRVAIVGCGAYMDSGYGCPANGDASRPPHRAREPSKSPRPLSRLLGANVPGERWLPISAWPPVFPRLSQTLFISVPV